MSETGASESLMLDDSDIGDLCISQTDHFTSNDFEEIDYQEGLDCTSEEVMTTEETIVIEGADSPSMEQVEIDGTENIEMGEIEDVEMDEVCEEEEELIEELEEENEEEHHLHEQQLIQEEEEQLEEEEFEHKEEVEEEEEGQEEEVLEEMEELEEEFQSLPAPQPPQPQVVYTTVSQPTQNVIFQTKPTLQKVPASTSLTMKQNVAAAAAAQGHQYMIVASPGGGPTNQLVKIVNAPVSSPSGHLQSVITAKSADGSIVQLRSAQTGKPLVATTQGANIQVSNIQSGKPITPTIKKSIQTGQQQQNRNVYAAKMLVGTSGTQSHQNQELLITTSGHDNQQQTFKLITSSSSGGGGNVGNSGKPLTLGQSQMNFVVQSPQSKIQNMLPQKQQQQQQGVYVNKMLQSTTPQASRLGGMTTGKQTPTKILPAPAQNQIRQGNVTNSQLTFTSTQKSIAQPNHQKVIIRGSGMKTGVLGSGQVIRLPANQSIVNSNQVHQIQMPGSRQVQYVRFVSTPSSSPTTSNVMTVGKPKTIQTIGVQQKINSGQQQQQQLVKVVPINATNQQLRTVAPRSTLVAPSTTQRILIPASPMNVGGQNKNTVGIPASRLSQLSTGQAILQANSNVGNFVVLPAQFTMQQPQQHHHHQTPQHKPPVKHKTPFIPPPKDFLDPIKPSVTTTPMVYNSPAPKNSASSLAGNLSTISESSHLASPLPPPQTPPTPRQPKSAASSPADSNGLRPRKPCNCTKSQCLKLYCDCFANGEFCHNCNCNNCSNNLVNENERQRAIKSCLDRNPNAFRPKIGKARDTNDDTRRHNKGCNCKRSGCLKNYCECYEAKIPCSNNCKCRGCRNVDDPVTEKKSAKDLVDAAESRSAQIMMEKARQLAGSAFRPQATTNTGARQPFHFMTDKVVEITCQCLLAQAEEAERNMYDEETSQRLVIEEFGRCLKEIIESAHKAEASSSST